MKQRAVSKDALRNYIQSYREEIRRLWERHETIPVLLMDYYPEIWDRVRACRFNFQAYQRADDATLWTARPKACHMIPWCIPCTRADNVRRAFKALDKLWATTPPGQPIRVHHVVTTAPYTEDGAGWGAKARHDPGKFFAVARRGLETVFGAGIGGLLNYQDFGERPFQKSHPHMDCIVNAYRVLGDTVEPVPPPQLQFGGAERVKDAFGLPAMAYGLDARPGNTHFRAVSGAASVFQTVKYSLRHMVDFANFEFRNSAVWYVSYRDAAPQRLAPAKFVDWLEEYRTRLGQYGAPDVIPLKLHRRFGYLGKGMFQLARRIVGGEAPAHDAACQCMDCQDWRKVFDEDFGQYGVRPNDLRARWGLSMEPGEGPTGSPIAPSL